MSLTLVRNPNPDSAPNDGAPTDGETGPIADKRAKGMDPEALLRRVIGWYKADRDHFQEWRQDAASAFDFVAGHQWSEEDKQILAEQTRPAITFNRIGPFIDAVGGLEINNRQETSYVPRQIGSSGVNDLLTGAAQWARQECDAEDEETEAFKDAIICGVGVIQSRMDYSDDPDGMIVMERKDPLEVLPDSSSRKQNYADGKRVMLIKDIPIDDACEMFPDEDEFDLDARWADDQAEEARTPHNARIAPFYRIDQAGEIDRETQTVRMVEVEWWQFEPAYRVLDPTSGRFVLLSSEDATRYAFRARVLGVPVKLIRDKRKKYYKAIFGAKLLKLMDGPEKGGFSIKFITGKRDNQKGTWYGIVRAMLDPQMWANKWLSQGLHILNTNAKGGYFAETDAFADIDEARDSLAESDSIVEVNPGKLQAIEPKQAPAFPPQLNTMMEMATQAIPMVSGINMELMGQSTSQAPQVAALEAGRRAQGMNVLAGMFNAKRRYQKEQGRLLLWMIQNYIADGRLIRIGGPENARYVALVHDPGMAEYDVIVDDAPTSTNMKEKVWIALMQMFPMLRGMQIPPQFYVNALKYAPVPESFVKESQAILSQPPPPNPGLQGKDAVDQARAALYAAQAQKVQSDVATQNVYLAREKQEADIELTRAQAINQLQNAGIIGNDQVARQTLAAIDLLLSVHGAALKQDDQAHQQAMDKARHAIDVHQATHGMAMDVAGHSLESDRAAHGMDMAEAGQSLAEKQARTQAANQRIQGS